MHRLLPILVATTALAACNRPASTEVETASPSTSKPATASTSTTFDANELSKRMADRRAVEAVIWGMPAVNFELMLDALRKQGGDLNQIVYWSRLPDSKNQTLTPNPDVIYVMPFYDTSKGPVVLEIPAANGGSITGSLDDGWQTAIEDIGPAGVDKGKGGKYLILPPGYKDPVPAGYIAMPSSTYAGYALLRSNIGTGSDADIAKAAEYARRIKLYPLADAAAPKETVFVDALGKEFDSTIPYDKRFYEMLDRFVQREPWIERDKAMIDTLRTIGIEKGKPYAPDADAIAAREASIREAKAWLEAKYDGAFAPYFPGHRWAVPVLPPVMEGLGNNFSTPDAYPVDDRGMSYTYGFFSAKHLGQGQFYLMTIVDKAGNALDGGRTYRLNVPANAPVNLYWSATAYDRETHALIRDQKWASRASTTQGLQKNADGSVDLFFGPKAPAGKDANWVPTKEGGKFEVLFRLYGPEKALFDKTWVLPDIELVEALRPG